MNIIKMVESLTLISVPIILIVVYLIILSVNIFFTWDFCTGDQLNLARFFIYQINSTAYCYYGILSAVILILIPVCCIATAIFKWCSKRRTYETI